MNQFLMHFFQEFSAKRLGEKREAGMAESLIIRRSIANPPEFSIYSKHELALHTAIKTAIQLNIPCTVRKTRVCILAQRPIDADALVTWYANTHMDNTWVTVQQTHRRSDALSESHLPSLRYIGYHAVRPAELLPKMVGTTEGEEKHVELSGEDSTAERSFSGSSTFEDLVAKVGDLVDKKAAEDGEGRQLMDEQILQKVESSSRNRQFPMCDFISVRGFDLVSKNPQFFDWLVDYSDVIFGEFSCKRFHADADNGLFKSFMPSW